MAVLLTGGAGFIGSHVCTELLGRGEDVVLLDNYSNSKQEIPGLIKAITGREFPVYEADILDDEALRNIFKENSIGEVLHFAGLKSVGESFQKPLAYYQNNITGTINLLHIMKEFDCKRMVYSSSATVYGNSKEVPFHEKLPVSAANPYSWTKLMSEQILKDLFLSDESWSIVLLRYFNPAGAHESGLIGEDPKGIPSNLVPYIAKVATGEFPSLGVFGDDYETQDGTGVRDYIHVTDLAAGHVSALDFARKNSCCETVNLGTGKGYSVFDMLHAYEKACGKKLEYTIHPRRQGDIAVRYADVSYAKELLGFQALLGIDEMCASSWHYIQNTF